jgi:hypothetical protein
LNDPEAHRTQQRNLPAHRPLACSGQFGGACNTPAGHPSPTAPTSARSAIGVPLTETTLPSEHIVSPFIAAIRYKYREVWMPIGTLPVDFAEAGGVNFWRRFTFRPMPARRCRVAKYAR